MSKLAILGGGPIGIETAALATLRGHDVTVFERGAIGAHVARWGHVRFFSPWKLNRSPWGEAALREAGLDLAPGDTFPTGAEYLRGYLYPLVEQLGLGSKIRNLTTVLGVTRVRAAKSALIGKREDAGPFVVSFSGPDEVDRIEVDVVFDATGVYGQPGSLGEGGLAAPGEASLGDLIERWIPDPADRDHDVYAGKRVLLVGDGYSASTTLKLLLDLREDHPKTHVTWVLSDKEPTYAELIDDPLPQRLELARFGNRAASGEVAGVNPKRTVISALTRSSDGVEVSFADGSTAVVDRIVGNVGYRPDQSLTRELQVHYCYASEGPMKLAASLLAQSGNADCLAQESGGIDTLRSPESDFWVIGNKSYGRNSNFLLRVGLEQIETILDEYD